MCDFRGGRRSSTVALLGITGILLLGTTIVSAQRNLFDEFSRPRGGRLGGIGHTIDELENLDSDNMGEGLDSDVSAGIGSDMVTERQRQRKQRRSKVSEAARGLGKMSRSRQFSKNKFNISIGTGEGNHPLSNLVYNDEVVIGKNKKGGITPDQIGVSHGLHLKSSTGKKTLMVEKCGKGKIVLSGGCSGADSFAVMKPLSKFGFMCRGGGSKRISAVCAIPDSKLDDGSEVVTSIVPAGNTTGTARCKDGYIAYGGGCDFKVNSQRLVKSSGPTNKYAWRCEASGPVEAEWKVSAICVKTKREVKRTLEKGMGEALAACPSRKKVVGGGCHVLGGRLGDHLSFSHPHISEGWQCRSNKNDAAIVAIAVCADYSKSSSSSSSASSSQQQLQKSALIAPDIYPTLTLHVSQANEDGFTDEIKMARPIVMSPGDGAPGARATVGWKDAALPKGSDVVPVPYARPARSSSLFDDDEEVIADIGDALEVEVTFECLAKGVHPMVIIFEFGMDGKTGYERITLAVHKNCTKIDAFALAGRNDAAEEEGTFLDDAQLERSSSSASASSSSSSSSLFHFRKKSRGSMTDLRVGLTSGGSDVISKGRVKRGWDQGHSRSVKIGPDEDARNFYISLEKDADVSKMQISRPVVFTDNSTVVKATADLLGSGGEFNVLTAERPTMLSVSFDCKEPGKTKVAVSFDTSVGNVRFQFVKECAGEVSSETQRLVQRTQGHSIPGFTVGTTPGRDNVIHNGFVRPEYFVPEVDESLEEASSTKLRRSRAVIVPGGQRNYTFYIGMNNNFHVLYSRPTVFADSDSKGPIAFPDLRGSYMAGNRLEDREIASLDVTFNCIRAGVADVIVTLPLVRRGTLSFAFRKFCDPKELGHTPKLLTVNGLNIGVYELDDVVKDGIPRNDYSWGIGSDGQLIEVGPEVPISRFVISREVQVGFTEKIIFEEPTITAHRNSIIDPELGTGTPAPFNLTQTQKAAKLGFIYNCKKRGSTLVTIALPWKLVQDDIDERGVRGEKVFMSTIHLHLIKTCNNPHLEVTRDEGGVDLPGFNVGYTKFSSNVVRDGYPTRHYFGQRNRINPDWKAITVPAETTHSTFYISYAADRVVDQGQMGLIFNRMDDGWQTQVIEFDAPIVHNHDAIARPRLKGFAADGLRLRRGDISSLTIQWNCEYNGTAAASVRIPIRPSGFITFTVPKICRADRSLADAMRLQEKLASGMYVSTDYTGEDQQMMIQPDVVDDGHTQDAFSTYKSGKRSGRFIVDPFEHSTMFFVWHQKSSFLRLDKGVTVLEPMIFTHRPICNPSLQHNFEYVQAQGFRSVFQESEMLLLVDNMVHAINITYNCVWEGETAVTVVIPMSNGGKVSYTWTKVCAEAEYDQHIPHCVQYKTPEESETILGAMWEYIMSFTVTPDQEAVHVECEVCEDGYLVLKAEDLPEQELLDIDGNPIPAPLYKRDECIRNASHFGFEDESFDNMDTENLEDDLAGNAPLVGEVDNNEGWHEHDEVNWKAHPVSAAKAAESQVTDLGTGFINIGSTKGANDVVELNTASSQYALQGGEPRVISSSEEETKFYVTAVQGMQKIGYAEAKTRLLEGESACSASIEGEASRSMVVGPDQSAELILKYKCEKPGASAVLVVIPLEPSGSVSFRVQKLCKGYQTRSDRAWYAHKSVLATSFAILLLVFCTCGDSFGKRRGGGSSVAGITLVPLGDPEAKYD